MTHKPMTLREAVNLINVDEVGDRDKYLRARSIVDAAVAAHEAACAFTDADSRSSKMSDLFDANIDAFNKLRAFERGEDVR